MTKRRRRAFSPEFRAEVVQLCHQPGKTVASVVHELKLGETAVPAGSTKQRLTTERERARAAPKRPNWPGCASNCER
jgi:transposase-like protein